MAVMILNKNCGTENILSMTIVSKENSCVRKSRSELKVDDVETSRQFQINYTLLMEHILESRLYNSEVHGPKHWQQVEFNGLLLADKTGADIDVVRLFAIFHDSKRANDNYDCKHGMRGAEFAKACHQAKLFDIDDRRFEKLYHACMFHTDECINDDITINTCYDADRLDLGRVGIQLNPTKMATKCGKELAVLSLNEHVPVGAMREWLRKSVSKIVLLIAAKP